MPVASAVRRRAALLVLLWAAAAPSLAQLAPSPRDLGVSGLALALRRLSSTARVLYVTAHPDDEHNGVLVRLSRGLGHRTALLTLTRGDGGQNEIGPELFEALGVLRTEELLAVHRVDGAEQYFSRAFEFGFSFSVDETFRRWGHDETLGDVVRVLRGFRPDVILTLPLASSGHQHHAAAAQLAAQAFRAAADPLRYPEQIASGLRPWQARKVYQGGVGGGREALGPGPSVVLPTGVYDPVLGMTWQELGSIARSFHRCQGASQRKASPGAAEAAYWLVDAEPGVGGREADVLDGVDSSWDGLSRFAAGQESKAAFLRADLQAIGTRVEAARAAFDVKAPERTLPALASGLELLRRLRARVDQSALPPAPRAEIAARLQEKEQDFLRAIPLAQGLVFEVDSDDGDVVPGQAFTVTASVFNQGTAPMGIAGLALDVPEGWTAERVAGEPRSLEPGQSLLARFSVGVAGGARPTQPYWRRSGSADRYEVDAPAAETLPFAPPDVTARLRYVAAGVEASLERPAAWRYEGPWVGGEKQKVVNVVPALTLVASPRIAVLPLPSTATPREVRVTLTSHERGATEAAVRLEGPPGFEIQPREGEARFRFEGEEVTLRFSVAPPPGLPEGDVELRAVARSGGREYSEGYDVIAYHHVQERHLFHPAATRMKAVLVQAAPSASVGYVTGVRDEVAAAIAQLGVPVTLLGEDDLAQSDLSRFTTIVTGVRAYKVRPDLRASHPRLMRYVEEGGNLVVQYNRDEFNQAGPVSATESAPAPARPVSPFAPYPAAATSERITDETAEVRLLVPDSPLFNAPNRIGPRDFEGWVQERGTAFLEARDPRYVELVSMADPFPLNAGEKKGALVEARVGRGTWTYVGLGLYRQVQAGTPGAYRLLANLVSRPRGR